MSFLQGNKNEFQNSISALYILEIWKFYSFENPLCSMHEHFIADLNQTSSPFPQFSNTDIFRSKHRTLDIQGSIFTTITKYKVPSQTG